MSTKNQKIAVIGLGKMGVAIAEKLLEAGHHLIVYNRTKNKAEPLQKMGATVADSIQSAVSDADIVFTSLIYDEALLSVSSEVLAHAKKCMIHVSTSTILPNTAKQLETQHQAVGC